MSMLAERKKKQKWSLNPRGKDWAQDSNKFGQKMLEKMGWSNGKGLGAKEDGITNHIKVSYKNDSKGMGYKESNDQWTEHESNFSALLDSLTGTESKIEEIKVNSLEIKSQTSRARVHYHKFTRGKDLSRYSEKDLANIFGKKSLKDIKKSEKEEDNLDSVENNAETNPSQFIYNGGSMLDYFKKKLPSFAKTNGYAVGRNGVLKKENSDEENEERPSFGFGFKKETEETNTYGGFGFKSEDSDNKSKKAKDTFVSFINNDQSEESNSEKSKKDKKKRKAAEQNEDNIFSPSKKAKIEESEEKHKKKKKSKKSKESAGLSNPAFEPMHTPVKIEKHILNTIEESTIEEIEDAEETQYQDSISVEQSPVEVHVQINNEVTPKSRKKNKLKQENEETDSLKKKKKIKKHAQTDDIETITVEEDSSKKKKTKKIIKETMLGTIDITEKFKEPKKIQETFYGTIDITEETNLKKKKTKKIEGQENPMFSNSFSECENTNQTEGNPYEVKIKEKKKKTKNTEEGLENPMFSNSFNESKNTSQIEENPYEVKVKEKKKKNKKGSEDVIEDNLEKNSKKSTEEGLTNPVFNDSIHSAELDLSQIEGNPYEVKKKNKKKKMRAHKDEDDSLSIDNPMFPNPINGFEVQRKRKPCKKERKEKGLDNPALNLSDSVIEESCDLMLNIVSTPVTNVSKTEESVFSIKKIKDLKRRKSVRFSDVTEERIIPSNYELQRMEEQENRNELFDINTKVINSSLEESRKGQKENIMGEDNNAFDKHANNLEENINSIAKTLDQFQSEIENDINEAKLKTVELADVMIGEVGNPHGPDEKLPDGTAKIKFKNAKFGKTPGYMQNLTGPKKSYKHLIKGDIILNFKHTNIHEIVGYATKRETSV